MKRVSDEQLQSLDHPDERAISPVWGNARISCADLADDLRDARAVKPRRVNEGTTHWDGCWREHHDCAASLVEKLQAEMLTESYCQACGSDMRSGKCHLCAAHAEIAVLRKCVIEISGVLCDLLGQCERTIQEPKP